MYKKIAVLILAVTLIISGGAWSARAETAVNLLQNDSFETIAETGRPDNWNYTGDTLTDYTADTTQKHSGAYALKITAAADTARAVYQNIRVPVTHPGSGPRIVYELSGYVYIPEDFVGTNAGVRAILYRSNYGNALFAQTVLINTATSGWKRFSVTYGDAAASFTALGAALSVTGAGSVYFDDITLKNVTGTIVCGSFDYDYYKDNATPNGWSNFANGTNAEITTLDNEKVLLVKQLTTSSMHADATVFVGTAIEALTVYKVSYMYKSASPDAGAQKVYIQFTDEANNKKYAPVKTEISAAARNQWSRVTSYVVAPVNANGQITVCVCAVSADGYYKDFIIEKDETMERAAFRRISNFTPAADLSAPTSVTYRYVGEAAGVPVMLVAYYDKTESILKGITFVNGVQDTGAAGITFTMNSWQFTQNLDETLMANARVKAMVWNGLTTLQPVATYAAEIE